jgi:hypothetical protein
MVKRLRQLNSSGAHDLFGAIQQALDTCCERPTTARTATLPGEFFRMPP